MTTDKFKITTKPTFSLIPSSKPDVTRILPQKYMIYEIMIMSDTTLDGLTPYDYLKKVEDEKETLFEELTMLDKTQYISATGNR